VSFALLHSGDPCRYCDEMNLPTRALRTLGAASLGLGVAALASAVAVHVAGTKIRKTEDPLIDELLDIHTEVKHHYLPTRDGASIHVVERIGLGDPHLTDAHTAPVTKGSTTLAQPVVLLHGVTLQWWVWGTQFNKLGPQHRVLAWDMRGHGESTVGSEGMTMEAIAQDLAELLEHFDLQDAIVVGHSMGGMALGAFCADHLDAAHDRVAGLMFLASSAATMAIPALTGGAVGILQLLASTKLDLRQPNPQRLWRNNNLSVVLVRWSFGRHPTAKAVEQVRVMLAESNPAIAQDAGRAIAAHDVVADLKQVRIPTLVVVGDLDRLTPPAHAEILVAAIPDSQLRILPDIGHQVMQEDPEALHRLIEELAVLTGYPKAP
jgi:pimeloyl-ACP methyl ester carboxylesterase